MLIIKLDKDDSVLLLEPVDALDKKDFQAVAATIDPFIEQTGQLKGLLIHTETFPFWDSFAAFVSHIKFVKDHHRKIRRVALATDSRIGSLVESLANHFVKAEIRHFPFNELQQARAWVTD